jgi:all-trans-retinol 13,14-reductase
MSQRAIAAPVKLYTGADTFDAIVIGSGMGGLGTAAILAKQGNRRVLVLERHYTAGGMTHMFRRPGFEWDVGVHYVGRMDQGGQARALMEHITEGRLQWVPMPDAYDRVRIGDDAFDYVRGTERLRAALHERFPCERQGIDRYFSLVGQVVQRSSLYFAEKAVPRPISALFGGLMRWPFASLAKWTTREMLDGLTDNVHLKAILAAQWGNYGAPPAQSSFAAHAMIAHHYFEGASYPVGGARSIAESVWPTVERAGGVMLVDAEVARIDVKDASVTGATTANGRVFRAPVVISDAGLRNTLALVSPDASPRLAGLAETARRLPRATGHLGLYIGLDSPVPVPAGNLWIYPGPDHDANVARSAADPEAPLPVVYVSWPGAKDPTFVARHEGHSTAEAITTAPWSWFSRWSDTRWKRRGADYDAFKARLSERLLDAVYAHAPEVRGHVKMTELSTPLSMRHFANHGEGEMYGLAHTPERFLERALRPRTPIHGLYLTGQDVTLVGVMGALASAYVCASAVLGRNAFAAVR